MNVKNMSAQGGSQPKADQPRAGATILGRKKILFFLTQSEFGGAQRYVFDLANNLKGDFEVVVALGEQGNNLILAKNLAENNIKYFIVPNLKRNISPIHDLLAFFQIIKLIKNYQPDIIHLNSSKISILGSLASLSVRPRLRVVYTVHGWVFNEPLPVYLKYFYLWAEKFTAKFKDKIICISEYDRQTALRYKIAPAEKMVTIHNGISPINFYPKNEARKILNTVILEGGQRPTDLPAGRQVESLRFSNRTPDSIAFGSRMTNNLLIGSIGNLYKTKGFEYFVQAADILVHPVKSGKAGAEQFNGVNQYHLAATFIIIGEGRERKNLENFINQYSLKNNFILTGQIDDAARILPALDIYVCSSVKEGLPYSVLEAMQAGLPVAATSVGGIPEMIINPSAGSPRPDFVVSAPFGSEPQGRRQPNELGTKAEQTTGLLAKPADAKDLAEKIKTLLNNKALAQELGQRAKVKVTIEFGLKRMVEETKKVYLS